MAKTIFYMPFGENVVSNVVQNVQYSINTYLTPIK
jgi:hypothetical protein